MKRFWKEALTERVEGGWLIRLDARPVRTPARRLCIVPVAGMADGIAAEWNAQGERVEPLSMPLTRAASTCLDRVMPEIDAVRRNVTSYGGTDLLCYRAPNPAELVARQNQGWDPLLDWAEEHLGARLAVGAGVMHIAQPPEAMERLARHVESFDAWELTGLSELTSLSGSLILALAVLHGRLTPEDAWALSRLDEQWNIEQWGEDTEAAQQTARRKADFEAAAGQLRLLGHG
ncbi:MAG TPA: ATP12 family protein [Paracoccaceae bacterium]|nr:ATP12 family protein [Paracoccaceae bacterium]